MLPHFQACPREAKRVGGPWLNAELVVTPAVERKETVTAGQTVAVLHGAYS
jgi:hypothetical protein